MQFNSFLLSISTLFFLFSCAGDSLLPVKGPERDPSTELSLAEFDDLPIPLNSKLDKEKSIIFSKKNGKRINELNSTNLLWIGQLSLLL